MKKKSFLLSFFGTFFAWFLMSFFPVISFLIYQKVALSGGNFTDIDSKAYLEWAQRFFEHGLFTSQGDLPYYALGYPMIIAFFYRSLSNNLFVIIMMQVWTSYFAGFRIFLLFLGAYFFPQDKILLRKLGALLGLLFFSFSVGYLTFSQFVLTEIFLAFFLLYFFEQFAVFIYKDVIIPLVLAAFALGCSIIIKPAALYYPILLMPLFFFVLYPKNLCRSFKMFVLFMFVYSVPVVGYMSYNKYVFNHFSIGRLGQTNLYSWFFPNVRAHIYKTTANQERDYLANLEKKHGKKAIKEKFLEEFKAYPKAFIFVWLKNVCKTFLGLFSTNLKVLVEPDLHGGDISFFKFKGSWWQRIKDYICAGTNKRWLHVVAACEAVWLIVRYVFVLFGLYVFFRWHLGLFYFFCSYLFYFSMITGHDGCARFRMMFEFVLIILAAVGCVELLDAVRKNKKSNVELQ